MMIEAFNTPDLTPRNIIASINCIIPITARQYIQPRSSNKNIQSQYQNKSLNIMKSLTLLGLIGKYNKKMSNINNQYGEPGAEIQNIKKYYLQKWYAKTKSAQIIPQVMNRILTQQSINNQGTFLYRIKSYCRSMKLLELQEQKQRKRQQEQQGNAQRNSQEQDNEQNDEDGYDNYQDDDYEKLLEKQRQMRQRQRQRQRQKQMQIQKLRKEQIQRQKQKQKQKQLHDKANLSNIKQNIVKQSQNFKNTNNEKLQDENQENLNKNNKINKGQQSGKPSKANPKYSAGTIKSHLRHISQQPSLPVSSQLQSSNDDILQTLDQKLNNLHARILVAGLRSCEIIIQRISYRVKKHSFDIIKQ